VRPPDRSARSRSVPIRPGQRAGHACYRRAHPGGAHQEGRVRRIAARLAALTPRQSAALGRRRDDRGVVSQVTETEQATVLARLSGYRDATSTSDCIRQPDRRRDRRTRRRRLVSDAVSRRRWGLRAVACWRWSCDRWRLAERLIVEFVGDLPALPAGLESPVVLNEAAGPARRACGRATGQGVEFSKRA
jgi:hypothetical protein